MSAGHGTRPAGDARAPIQLEEGIDGGWAVLRGPRQRGAASLPRSPPATMTPTTSSRSWTSCDGLGGENATRLWDRGPLTTAGAPCAWLNTQRSWLVVERLPAYAPE